MSSTTTLNATELRELAAVDELSELCACLERVSADKPKSFPLSTYRLQLNNRFRFEDARKLVPYLYRLGIAHVYTSPILMARSGSQHGYDIIDHNRLNPEIGTEAEFRQLVAELKQRGMGLLLDIVPNHMGVGHGTNPWWQDVLQNGRTSMYADFFDIDWEPLKPELRNKVLLPILGHPYGEDLESGNIKLKFDAGRFTVEYFDKILPIDPQTIPLIFAPPQDRQDEPSSPVREQLASMMNALSKLPLNGSADPDEVRRRQRELPDLVARFLQLVSDATEIRDSVGHRLEILNGRPGESRSFDALHELLERQPYRLAFWRVSGEEINYRRFFDINDLVGLRMENPRVFAETHKLIRKLLADGSVTGLRLDHPDGLLNPSEYVMRLQRLYAASRCLGPEPQSQLAPDGIELDVHRTFAEQCQAQRPAPLYLLVEKILEAGEHLPDLWPVDGSVGYDFGDKVNNLFIDGRNQRAFTRLYERLTGSTVRVQQIIHDSKKLVMRRALASEVNVLAHRLNEISNQDRRARDFTLAVLREAIRETIACFPVYRTYIDERGQASERDRQYIEQAIECAKHQNSALATAVFDFLRSILLLEGDDSDTTIYGYRKKLYFTLKFQQLTGPVMAKGLEDTACYVYARFLSANEVGGSPADFGISVSEFHQANQERAERWPCSMLSTSTHDTKRSEDVRARLDVLSEMPNAWASQVMKWRRINRPRKMKLADGRVVPDSNEEYLLYQTLVGAWPLSSGTKTEHEDFFGRIQQYMDKALHEAKVNLSWLNPNPEYVEGTKAFLQAVLSPTWRGKPNSFRDSIEKFVRPIIYFGFINSLSQTLLKLTCPGVPDVYQGQEMWDFSLVDPDNRRPVDFELRQRWLDELTTASEVKPLTDICQELLLRAGDGRIKLWMTMRALNFRRDHDDLCRYANYVPLHVTRGREEHVVAFARQHAAETAIIAVPRFAYTLMRGKEEPPLGQVWGDAELVLPATAEGRRFRNIFTGEVLEAGASLLCREVFGNFPVALLSSD
jgi:(1->4)-alpha-D-glucan 1-alpha-D-glucosylmutase